ncbi:hypothetical protein ABK040_010815 [Willaertia magna]
MSGRKETKDNIDKFCDNLLSKFNFNKNIEIYLVNDLKSLDIFSDLNCWNRNNHLFCPFCNCPCHLRHQFDITYENRNLKLNYNLKAKIMICEIHAKMRLVCNLLCQLFKRLNNVNDFILIENNISSLPNFSQFKYRTNKLEDENDFDQHLP